MENVSKCFPTEIEKKHIWHYYDYLLLKIDSSNYILA
jgi:hypothetical protein